METTKAEKAFLNKKEAKDGESLIRSQPNRLEPSCVIDRHLAFFGTVSPWMENLLQTDTFNRTAPGSSRSR
jgi:hypothetical protein